MIFSDFYKGPRSPLAKLRQQHPAQQSQQQPNQRPVTPPPNAPEWSTDEHTDLLSKDKTKCKEAVKRYLAEKVRNDWVFSWPSCADVTPTPPKAEAPEADGGADVVDEINDDEGYQVDDGDLDLGENVIVGDDDEERDDTTSIYSVIEHDPLHYKILTEWDSDAPAGGIEDDDSEVAISKLQRTAQKRRDHRKEMEYNEGLACFEARRNAWTEARTVRLRVTTESCLVPASPQRSPRRFFFRRSMSGASSATIPPAVTSAVSHDSPDTERETPQDSASHTSAQSSLSTYPVETVVPIPPPILPPHNILRASIQPSHYVQLYDKLIVNSLTPACPINLSDMISACVAGWKRDGEWPPRGTPAEPAPARKKKRTSTGGPENGAGVRRLSLTGLLSSNKDGTGKGVRQSLQRAFGLGGHIDTPHGPEKANI